MDILHQDRLDANAKCPRLGHQKVQAGRGYLPSLQTPLDPVFLNAVKDLIKRREVLNRTQ
jgi:hypothetical protein